MSDVRLTVALELMQVAMTPEAASVLGLAVKELRRLKALEAVVMACFEAGTDQEKKSSWAEVKKLCRR